MDYAQMQTILARAGVQFAPGLTEDEFDPIERRFSFTFPPDLRAFLAVGLPVSDSWPDWRGDETPLRERLAWPLEGIRFDIEHNQFWLDEWGPRPADLNEAFAMAERAVLAAPVLIPIFSHRYLPASPCEAGNPVFSVYQTDIIYYGVNLLDYFQNEFPGHFGRASAVNSLPTRRIDFWSRLEELNG